MILLDFRLAFKSRVIITPPIRHYTSPVQSESKCQHLPWFLSFGKVTRVYANFTTPIHSDAYEMNVPREFEGAIVRHAKYDWLLMSQGMYSVFFFKPSTREIIQLTETDRPYTFESVSFSSPPTSSDCVVFGLGYTATYFVNIHVYRKCEDTWCMHWLPITDLFLPSHCSPVFCDGLFYTLAKDGRLGVFDPKETKEQNMWRLLPNAFVREVTPSQPEWFLPMPFIRSYIMEYDGEIVSVFLGHQGIPVWIYKLDRSEMKWVRLESLGEKVAGLKGVGNKIYLPRLSGRDLLFYSLSTGKYHCFGSNESREDWINTSEDWNCTWIQINK